MNPTPNELSTKPKEGWVRKTIFAAGTALLFVLAVAAYLGGLLSNFLFGFMFLLVPITIISRIWSVFRKQIVFNFLCAPFRSGVRWHLLQLINRWAFWIALMVTLQLAVIPIQFKPDDYHSILIMSFGSAVLLMMLEFIPAKRIHLSTNLFFTAGWLFLGYQFLQIYLPPSKAESVLLTAPFRGDWYVFQGGRSALINHHYPISSQRNALDICKVEGGRFSHGDPKGLESYAAFGASLFAPGDGKVVRAVDGRPDMPIGKMDRDQIVGNHLVIELAPDRFVLMAHLMKGSLAVAEYAQVQCGQPVARCGNSGNTSQPHLHLQVQNRPDFNASDLKTFPILFRDAVRVRAGNSQRIPAADLRRNDQLLVPEAATKS